MQQGKTMAVLVEEVSRIAKSAQDYLVPSTRFDMQTREVGTWLLFPGSDGYLMRTLAHQQIAGHLQIPMAYYSRLQENHPDLLDHNVNTLHARAPREERRLVRVVEGQVRAYLSDRYRRIDHWDILQAVLPDLVDRPELGFVSCEVTEHHMYVKVVSSRLVGEVRQGDVVRVGLMIRNSEVGLGAFEVSPFSERLVCLNGMIHTEYGKRKRHLGSRLVCEEENLELFSDETVEADDKAFLLKCRDIVRHALSDEMLAKVLRTMQEAAGIRVTVAPRAGVQVLQNKFRLQDNERENALLKLIEARDTSLWGYANALTALANDMEDYDRATEIQGMGGELLVMPKADLYDLRLV